LADLDRHFSAPVVQVMPWAFITVLVPSPLAGEGGRAQRGRMRGYTGPDDPRQTDPSSGPAGHLLPQGEKEGRLAPW